MDHPSGCFPIRVRYPNRRWWSNHYVYLFITVSKLNSYIQIEGTVPETEEEFLGYDDPSIEYEISGNEYSVSVLYADTVLVWHYGEDPSKFLTEDALERMGIAN
jgi:hypothetical protein